MQGAPSGVFVRDKHHLGMATRTSQASLGPWMTRATREERPHSSNPRHHGGMMVSRPLKAGQGPPV